MTSDNYTPHSSVYHPDHKRPVYLGSTARPFDASGTITEQVERIISDDNCLLTSPHELVPVYHMSSKPMDVRRADFAHRFVMRREGEGVDGRPKPEKAVAVVPHPTKAQVRRCVDGFILDGVVGRETFGLYQPADMARDAAEVASLVPGATLSWASVGKGGSQILFNFDLGKMRIGGEDYNKAMTVRTGLDGSAKREIYIHTRRLLCWNMMASVRAEAKRDANGNTVVGVKNTSGANRRTRQAWGRIATFLEGQGMVERKLNRLYKVGLPTEAVRDVAEALCEARGIKRDGRRWDSSVTDLIALYNDPRADHANLHGSLAGMHCAATYGATHLDTVQGFRGQDGTKSDDAAQAKALDYTVGALATKAETFLGVMDALAEKSGIPLEDAGIMLGEDLAGPDGGEVKAYSVADLLD